MFKIKIDILNFKPAPGCSQLSSIIQVENEIPIDKNLHLLKICITNNYAFFRVILKQCIPKAVVISLMTDVAKCK